MAQQIQLNTVMEIGFWFHLGFAGCFAVKDKVTIISGSTIPGVLPMMTTLPSDFILIHFFISKVLSFLYCIF
jgi:hypothetical protein